MTMKRVWVPLTIAAATLVLAACEKTREQFDFSKTPPDEFAVVKRAPLEMPPDYTLRPPQPGAARPQELSPEDEARQSVLGSAAARPADMTEGESILLQKTGAYQANSDIRRVVDQETSVLEKEEKPTIDRLLSITGKKYDAPASVVDPVAETERLRQNEAEGKPVNEGETPAFEQ